MFPLLLSLVTNDFEYVFNDPTTWLTSHWRHNNHDCVSNHQPHGCLLNRLFRRRSKKTSKLRVTGLCVGNSPGPVNSPHKGPVTRKCFHLMTSSWKMLTRYRKHYDNSTLVTKTLGLTSKDIDPTLSLWVDIWYDGVIKWKHFPCYWPFVRGIHRWPVNSPLKGQRRGAFMFSLICPRING